MLHTVTRTTMLLMTLVVSGMIYLMPANVGRGLFLIGSVNALGMVVLLLNRRGRTQVGSVVLVTVLVMLMTGLAPTAGGIRAPAMTFSLVIVMMAGLLGERIGIYTGVACVMVGFAMILAEIYGVLPEPMIRHTAGSLWLSNSLLVVIAIALQRLATRTVRSALDRAERELADRKRREERLKAGTQRLQLALDAGEIGVWDRDLRTNRVVYDDRLFSMCGLSPTLDHTVSYQDWARQVHPQDLPQQETALRRLATEHDRRREPGLVVHERRRREFRITRPDGAIRHFQSAAAVITDEQGTPLRLVGMNTDVTEQKQAEREREKLVHDLGERLKEL